MAIAPDFVFVGRLCLDLTLTGDMGYGSQFERLTAAGELRRWLSIGELRLSNVQVTQEDLELARILRRAIWSVVGCVLEKIPPAPHDVCLINRMAQEPDLVRELGPRADSLRWHHPTAAAALATIARDAVVLIGEPKQRARIRRCEDPRCRIVFYDDSRPGLRRWCAPNRCGDRVRAKLYRERHKVEDPAAQRSSRGLITE